MGCATVLRLGFRASGLRFFVGLWVFGSFWVFEVRASRNSLTFYRVVECREQKLRVGEKLRMMPKKNNYNYFEASALFI